MILLAFRARERENEHVLGHPALVLGELRGDSEREALLAEKRIAAVARAERPDFAVFRELRDVLILDLLGARPCDILLTLLERRAHRVDARHEGAILPEVLENFFAGPRHDIHVHDDVGRIGELDAILGNRVADRTHRERNHVHRAALHAALVGLGHLGLHLHRVHPVVGGAGIDFALGADEGAPLDARNITLVRTREIAARTLLRIERDELALLDHLFAYLGMLLRRTLHDDNLVRRADFVPLVYPREHFRVGEFRRFCHVLCSLMLALRGHTGNSTAHMIPYFRPSCLSKSKKLHPGKEMPDLPFAIFD